ncbi:MAG TPA: nuclear transport factor 2 family protein [Gemmatimonadota bacterium]
MILRSTIGAGVVAALLCGCGASGADDAQLAALAAKVAALEQRKGLVEDANAVERLQAAYGYYTDRGLWDEAADLFADDGTIEIALDGVYAGKARVREYLYALGDGRRGLADGRSDAAYDAAHRRTPLQARAAPARRRQPGRATGRTLTASTRAARSSAAT